MRFLSIVLLTLLIACRQPAAEPAQPPSIPLHEQLNKTWYVTDLKNVQSPDYRTETAQFWKENLIKAGVLFQFFPDGQWAFIEGTLYHPGQWTLDEPNNKIQCTYANPDSAATMVIKIRRMSSDSMVADLIRKDQIISVVLKTDHYKYATPEKCPWHPANNQWRIKPDHAETDGEIRMRFINHLRHYCMLLEAMLDNKGQTIVTKNSPSCIQLYTSGIGLRTADKIDRDWYSTFYDQKDAEKALIMFRKLLPADGVFTGPKTRNWVSDNLTLLQRLMNRLQGEK